MGRLTDYIIPFHSYSNGIYKFDYELDEEFFEHFPESGIRQPELKVAIVVWRIMNSQSMGISGYTESLVKAGVKRSWK